MASALKLGRIWAATPTSPNVDPGDAKYKLGWVAEIPVFQMLNYIQNRYDTNVVAHAERGMFEWGGDVTYKNAAMVWDEVDGFIYVSKVANPSKATRPGLNATQWDKSSIQISRAQYDTAVANWNNHIANTSNPHQLTTEILNTYTKAVIDSKVEGVQIDLDSHTSNMANPHVVTAVQVGAVPVTGGDYSGLARHLFASTGIGASSFASSLLSDATGTFLAKGVNAKLGMDSDNHAVFIDDAGTKGNLLLDSSYIAAREAVEASYVPPTPDCEVQLRNSLAMLYGSGVTANFIGPAGSRGYLDKSGIAQTAGLNQPRFTVDGIYMSGFLESEAMSCPIALNLWNSNNYTWCVGFKSTAQSVNIAYVFNFFGPNTSGVSLVGGYYIYRSMVGGVQTAFQLALADHTKEHKVTVVSDAAANKTFVYLDGVLKATVNNSQDYVSGENFYFCDTGATYFQSYRTWLAPLTARQVSNL